MTASRLRARWREAAVVGALALVRMGPDGEYDDNIFMALLNSD